MKKFKFILVLISLIAFGQKQKTKNVNCLTVKETDTLKLTKNKMSSKGKNVFGNELELASLKPLTGFYRDGFCSTGIDDNGIHVVAAVMTDEFLNYSKGQGNDLITPNLNYGFPGLKAGDTWCLCALRWKEALKAGVAPPVLLSATHQKALEYVSLAELKANSIK